jgi:hypothetical protein
LKVIGLLLGQQRGYTKFPCFLCEWDSIARDKHWDTVHWPEREQLQPGSKNVSNVSLVDREKFLLPPMHIKLGMMKQFVMVTLHPYLADILHWRTLPTSTEKTNAFK